MANLGAACIGPRGARPLPDRDRPARAEDTGSCSSASALATPASQSLEGEREGLCRDAVTQQINRALSVNDRRRSRCLHRSDSHRASRMVSIPAARSRISRISCGSERPLTRVCAFRRWTALGWRPRTRIEACVLLHTKIPPVCSRLIDRARPNPACSSQAGSGGCHLVAIRSASATGSGARRLGERL
jgi:hypothetical protein